jgi:hypothetical protein
MRSAKTRISIGCPPFFSVTFLYFNIRGTKKARKKRKSGKNLAAVAFSCYNGDSLKLKEGVIMPKQIRVVLLGAGNRANVYAKTALAHPDKMQVVGIVDPDPVRRELMREKYGVSPSRCYENVEAFVAEEKFADAVINGTMDHLHVPTSIPVLEKGYDLLLEKPFAVNEEEALELCRVAKENGSRVVIGHVLRYTEFYRAIKDQLMAGAIGEIISIESCEHVNYHHMAVSYVRGKWRSEKLCFAPFRSGLPSLLYSTCTTMARFRVSLGPNLSVL